jgi:hypothetical protein
MYIYFINAMPDHFLVINCCISDNKYEDIFSQQPWNRSSIPGKVKEHFSSPKCPIGSGVPTAFQFEEYRWCFPGDIEMEAWTNHSASSSAEAKEQWSHSSITLYAFMVRVGQLYVYVTTRPKSLKWLFHLDLPIKTMNSFPYLKRLHLITLTILGESRG